MTTNYTRASLGACLYMLSGVAQPIIMEFCKDAGLADPSCQIYMVFYYLGPASVAITLLKKSDAEDSRISPGANRTTRVIQVYKSCGIAIFDLLAQILNYTGAGLAGPTIFAIVYSSVTVWTAVWSRIILGRRLSCWQWMGIAIVFFGLAIAGLGTVSLSDNVIHGLFLVLFGSVLHAATYVMNEAVMTTNIQPISVSENCAIQGIAATLAFIIWQCIYTIPRFTSHIWNPMKKENTTILVASCILLSFALANLIHAYTYFYTLKNFPSGAVSAGVMKGLQAVLVFVLTDVIFCGTKSGGEEMCFTRDKFYSLLIVVTGVIVFGIATERSKESRIKEGYTTIGKGIEKIV